MEVDDLFGDAEQVALPTISVPPVKGLARRLDELSASGCCQKIAWSKNGCVAYITPDGYAVHLRVFCRDPATGRWDLGKDTPLEMPHGQDDQPYVHLSWSHLGNDLAVLDATGHLMIFSCAMALDRMSFMKIDLPPSETEMEAVIGIHWLGILPYEQKNQIAWSTNLADNKWKFRMASHTFQDAHHPVEGKASLMYLRRHGELRMRFQQTDNTWHEVSAKPGQLSSTRETLTHAAFASNNDNTLLLATYNSSGQLHLYRVEVSWNLQPQKAGQTLKVFDKPTLQVTDVTPEDYCYPTSPTVVNGDMDNQSEPRIRIPAQLTHLSFLPVTPEQNDGTMPTIQAIFSTPSNVVSLDQSQQQSPFSIIVKLEVHQTLQNQLHSNLDKVTSKKKSVSAVPSRNVFLLKRLPETIMHSVILSFTPLWYNMFLAFCHSDGTIEFRKRSTMEIITPDYNTTSVTSLPQAGFSFPPLDPSPHIALSPNYCMAVCMQQDGVIKLRSMEYTHGSLATDEEDARHYAALAALTLQSASSANQYFTSDDIFSIIGELSDNRKRQFVSLLYDCLNVNLDCGVDEQAGNQLLVLGRSPYFVKILSATHLLGLQGTVNRSVTSKMAWMILNIKYVTQILTTIARMHGHLDKQHLRPEVVPQFIGICRWIMHFINYMIDEVFAVAYSFRNPPSTPLDRATLEARIHELNKPAILILLSAFPRMMMKLWGPPLQWINRTALLSTNNSVSPESRKIYFPLHHAVSEIPLDWRLFEALVSEAQHLVRSMYKRHSLSDAQRNAVERDLMLGRVPDVLMPVAKRLLTDSLFNDAQPNGCLADKLDIAKVMFFDTTWLGLQHSRRATAWFDSHVVDVCQKMVIRGTGAQSSPLASASTALQNRKRGDGAAAADTKAGVVKAEAAPAGDARKRKPQLRQCVRCGAYMEDVTQGMPGYAPHHIHWLMGVAKHCVCGNSWMLAEEKKMSR
ncbi:mediator complex, subunit Med16 [Massariosphaeria phaeospora]|uniref:Mediator of RNA polymerase II transcription subunit 16 n=1 Tax=Massariosphaeria phaeospora TaxID=100035 RepID=A0A7C8MGV6_9PLEO|nr:mediator complex, subunit Med16 [Massariosphaeria phaeospora]